MFCISDSVICLHMGYDGGVKAASMTYPDNVNAPMHFFNLACPADASNLNDCIFDELADTTSDPSLDAGVHCIPDGGEYMRVNPLMGRVWGVYQMVVSTCA